MKNKDLPKYFPHGLLPEGHRACALTGKPMRPGSIVVQFGGFIRDEDDPFMLYSGWPMLREAFDEWEQKEAFLARWRESILAKVIPGERVLVNEPDYHVALTDRELISIVMFAYGFLINGIPRDRWKDFENLLLVGPRRAGEFTLHGVHGRLEVWPDRDGIGLVRKPPPIARITH